MEKSTPFGKTALFLKPGVPPGPKKSHACSSRRSLLAICILTAVFVAHAEAVPQKAPEWQRRNKVILKQLVDQTEEGQQTIQVDDMVFRVDQLKKAAESNGALVGRAWPGGLVYYSFAASVTQTLKDRFSQAFSIWEAETPIDFVKRTNEVNYVWIIVDNGNYSSVGLQGGKQNLAVTSNASVLVMLHELGHALLMHHEHQRSDRDDFVIIFTENVDPNNLNNFNLVTSTINYTPYDFLSIMHYSRSAFSTNGQNTIEPLPLYSQFLHNMGLQSSLSLGDVEAITKLYRMIPHLVAPEASSAGWAFEGTPITWSTVPGAFAYNFQASLDASFSQIVVNDTVASINQPFGGLTTQTDSLRNLVPSSTHFWRVRAQHEEGFADWSDTLSFSTIIGTPVATSLVSPEDGAVLSSENVDLVWEASAETESYHLQVALDLAFISLVHETPNTRATSLTVGPLEPGPRYYWRVRPKNLVGVGPWTDPRSFVVDTETAIDELEMGTPRAYLLSQNYPNPFNPVTTIQFDVPKAGIVTLRVYDLKGREIATLWSGRLPVGSHHIEWDADKLPSGVYIYQLVANSFTSSRKLTLLR